MTRGRGSLTRSHPGGRRGPQAALVTTSTSAHTTAMSAASITSTRQTCRRAVGVSVDREEATGAAMISHFRLSEATITVAICNLGFVTPVINVSQVACGVAICAPRVAWITLLDSFSVALRGGRAG